MAQNITGKIMVAFIVVTALFAGGLLYYTQVYAYYYEVTATGTDDVQLTGMVSGLPETILYEDFRAIDADSSPIRYRACFTTPSPADQLRDTYKLYPGAEPRVAPSWFDCFNAEAIGEDLAAGRAVAFTGQRNITYGIDRVVAVTQDGHGYIWHEINECGDKAYDGTPLGDDCPERE
ncbi:hypothetical protein P775_18335 [Puniceibacterium antarcticum]|uniref:Histidine kinase n=2 Tax=Puniceibacterium antarcticum TaxID=1206336 RepID=A0A2G8RAL0_9RHOB|nr:hypothetical protein P775_18335 [Puniceibacterium antarcticum]